VFARLVCTRDDELPDTVDRLLALRQEAREQLPYVDHLGPHFKFGADASRPRPRVEPGRIIKQRFRIANLDQ
jgi:hypothetical protein